MISINGKEYDLLEVIHLLREVQDSIEGMKLTTRLIDLARDGLLVELAGLRREFTVLAREALMAKGMSAADATRHLANESQTSPQSIARMINERGQYGVPGPPPKEEGK